MNPLKTNLLQFNNDEKTSFRGEYEKLKEAAKHQWIVSEHLEKCAKAVGGFKQLASIVKPNEGQIRAWRKGGRMKATTAMNFEIALNAWLDANSDDAFRCDRKKLIAWFFVGEVTKFKLGDSVIYTHVTAPKSGEVVGIGYPGVFIVLFDGCLEMDFISETALELAK